MITTLHDTYILTTLRFPVSKLAPPACLMGSALAMFSSPGFGHWLTQASLALLIFGLALQWTIGAGFRALPRWITACIAVLVLSVIATIPCSYYFGAGEWREAFGIAITTLPFVALAFCKIDYLELLIGAVLIAQSLYCYVEWVTGVRHVTGLTINENAAGGLIVVLAAYLIRRYPWVLYFALPGVIATGSRGSLLALAVVVLIYLVISRKWWMFGLLLSIGVGVLYVRQDIVMSLIERWQLTQPITFVPHGPIATPLMHSVPLRIGVENGVVALVAWMVLTVWALIRQPRWSPAWLAFGALTLLSLWEYSTWVGQLAPLWWMFSGMDSRTPKIYPISNQNSACYQHWKSNTHYQKPTE